MFVQRFALAGNASDRKTIRLGIVINANAARAHVWVISNCHTLPATMSSMTPGLKKPMTSTYTYMNMTLAHSAASFSFTCTLTSSSSLLACLLSFIVYSFVDVMGRRLTDRWHAVDREQRQAQVAHSPEQAVQRGLVDNRAGQPRRAV